MTRLFCGHGMAAKVSRVTTPLDIDSILKILGSEEEPQGKDEKLLSRLRQRKVAVGMVACMATTRSWT